MKYTNGSPKNTPAVRKRGGQPGNQNARKHGFYARTLTPEQTEAQDDARIIADLEEKTAVMRVKLADLLAYPDTPGYLIIQAFNTLGRLVEAQHRGLR